MAAAVYGLNENVVNCTKLSTQGSERSLVVQFIVRSVHVN